MKRQGLILLIFIFLLFGTDYIRADTSQTKTYSQNDSYWELKSSSATGLEINFHFPEAATTLIQLNNKTYQRVSIGQLGTFVPCGAPEIPGLCIPFYAPPGSNIEISWQGKPCPYRLEALLPPRPTTVIST
ncbi:hypothetical protein ACFL27_26450, partial [candidate division CSSED10-310 bacterium]